VSTDETLKIANCWMIILPSRLAVSVTSSQVCQGLIFSYTTGHLFASVCTYLLYKLKLFHLAFDIVLPNEDSHALQVPYDVPGLNAWSLI
jgi:hypothetical protein